MSFEFFHFYQLLSEILVSNITFSDSYVMSLHVDKQDVVRK